MVSAIKILPFTVIYFVFIMFMNGFVAINMVDPLKYAPALPDYGHSFLPFITNKIPNYMLCIYFSYFMARILFSRKILDLVKFMLCINFLFTLRLLTFTMTIEPPPLPRCTERNSLEPLIWNIVGFIIDTSDRTCIDNMFSGHACYITTIFLYMLQQNIGSTEKFTNIIVFITATLSIIASHIHYTSDVIIGIALSTLTYNSVFGFDLSILTNYF